MALLSEPCNLVVNSRRVPERTTRTRQVVTFESSQSNGRLVARNAMCTRMSPRGACEAPESRIAPNRLFTKNELIPCSTWHQPLHHPMSHYLHVTVIWTRYNNEHLQFGEVWSIQNSREGIPVYAPQCLNVGPCNVHNNFSHVGRCDLGK